MSRIKGKVSRKLLKQAGETTPHTFFIDKTLEDELRAAHDGDSMQVILYAMALDATGYIDLRKDKIVDIEKVIEERLRKLSKK